MTPQDGAVPRLRLPPVFAFDELAHRLPHKEGSRSSAGASHQVVEGPEGDFIDADSNSLHIEKSITNIPGLRGEPVGHDLPIDGRSGGGGGRSGR